MPLADARLPCFADLVADAIYTLSRSGPVLGRPLVTGSTPPAAAGWLITPIRTEGDGCVPMPGYRTPETSAPRPSWAPIPSGP